MMIWRSPNTTWSDGVNGVDRIHIFGERVIDQSLLGYRQVGVARIPSRILRLLKMQRSRRFATRSYGIFQPPQWDDAGMPLAFWRR